jgi:signal transduction histidine kinase/DNA-binding response OmpR family regulator
MSNKNRTSRTGKNLSLLEEKLKISQSLVKIGFWEYRPGDKKVLLSDEALHILKLNGNKPVIEIEEFAGILSKNKRTVFYKKIRNIENEPDELNFEFVLKSKNDPEQTWIKVVANPHVRFKKNKDIIIGIVQDISEHKKSETMLKQAKERAEEADTLKSIFLANMSHEIRTPLNAIVGFSRLLTNSEISNSQRHEYSEYIASSANNLLNLIRDIVDVSKIEAGRVHIEILDCEVNRILNELRFTFENEKKNQMKDHIRIIMHKGVADNQFAIRTDPYRFHQIMVNLIGNALKFIENGSIEFGYTLKDEKFLVFYVKDSGIGIPADKIDLIFSRFGQIINNKIKNPGGTGLGLSITKYLVERLGGKIWVDSKPNEGTTFYFTLPYLIPDHKIKATLQADAEITRQKLEDIKILAVEDDQINMILLEDTLKIYAKNVRLTKAHNGIEAIEKLKEEHFDIIIMDVRMPLMDGYETSRQIRRNFPYPKNETPILGLSAHALKDEIEKGKKAGMNDFLAKPVIPEDMILKMNSLLKNSTGIAKAISIHDFKGSAKDQKMLIDLVFLRKIFRDDEVKIKNTLAVYLRQIPGQIKTIMEADNTKEIEKLKNAAHSLKSSFKYIGRADLSELARQIELDIDPLENNSLFKLKINQIKKEWLEIEKVLCKICNE